ncbi:MAG: glutathione S-transferase [Sandaracinus sp.]|nr:glutathione S-transferase [Sandaracinus sp.]|tara:strand:+ start:319 stop:1038 length:720 start_codon:yes stop_codon:yes gene_type:complete
MSTYELYYWPTIPGRGEPVRLTFAMAEVAYRDMAREAEDGYALLLSFNAGEHPEGHPFAPPYLVIEEDGERTLHWQSAHLCDLVAARHGLYAEADRSRAASLGLTLADLMDEAHDTHHPLATGLYYEDQKDAAQVRAKHFREERIPKFLGFFESQLDDTGHLVGGRPSPVDAVLWHVREGLRHAFPKAMASFAGRWPKLDAMTIADHPPLRAYLDSEGRIPFNEDGIFRRYPELDGAVE